MSDDTEADRLAIIDDLITRYLADELDRRQLTEWVTMSQLSDEWSIDAVSGWLRMLVAHHLFMFERGDWPEDTLRTSQEQLQERATGRDGSGLSVMVDKQWVALMRAGHVPPGFAFWQTRLPHERIDEN